MPALKSIAQNFRIVYEKFVHVDGSKMNFQIPLLAGADRRISPTRAYKVWEAFSNNSHEMTVNKSFLRGGVG
jgi:hypothetical protein